VLFNVLMYLFLDNIQVWSSYSFVSGDNNIFIIKLAKTLDFMPFKSLLIFETCMFTWDIIVLELISLINMITCFLKDFLVVILSSSLLFTLLLYITLLILMMILPKGNFGNTFLILRIFSILTLVVWVNNQIFEIEDWVFL